VPASKTADVGLAETIALDVGATLIFPDLTAGADGIVDDLTGNAGGLVPSSLDWTTEMEASMGMVWRARA
jgi:hypothetical protein